jgi:RNA polymerase sigma-70 factor (ECF subfamily)
MAMAKSEVISKIAPSDLQMDAGDFEALVMEHGQQLYNIALRMTGNEEDANDLTQEALLRAYKAFSKWKRECSFSSWLFRIATNLYIDQVRRRKRIRFESLDSPIVTDDGEKLSRTIESDARSPQSMAEAAEVQEKVQLALQKLSPEFRMSIILCDIQGFSYAEISEIMDCSIGTVRSRIHRARRALKDHLEPYVSEAMADEL